MDDGKRIQKVRLTVIMASQLRKALLLKTPVCFATISVDGEHKMQTKRSRGTNPGWNESFELKVEASSSIMIAVIRTSSFLSDRLIGEVSLSLKDTLEDGLFSEHAYQLCKNGSQAGKLGNITVRLELVEHPPEHVSQNQDPTSSHKSETLATASKESGGKAENSSIPTKSEVLQVAKDAGHSANRLSRGRGASNAGAISGGMDDLEALAGNSSFNLVCGLIEKLTNMGDVISEIHPYAKVAWSILSLIPKSVIAQLNRDRNIRSLWSTAADMLDFLKAAEPVIDEIQRPVVENMLKQIHDCALFVQEYSGNGFCKRALRDTSSSESDKAISQYVTAFQRLKEQFKSRSSLSKLKVFREVREGLVEVGVILKEQEQRQMMERLLNAIGGVVKCDEDQACLSNTRVSLLDEVMEWVDDPGRPQYFWLHGPAGAGKSTVANTIVSRCKNLGRLGASFSFKRDIPGRNVPDFVFGTLAYQLAVFSSHFREQLSRAIDISGNISQQPLHTQLREYIIAPLEEVSFSGPMVIVIDALDECGDESTREDFFKAWSQELSHLPAFVKVLFVSRSEDDIRVHLESTSSSTDIGGAKGTPQDILTYIEDQMQEVHRRHRRLPSDWPSQDEKDELGRCADGLFIWVKVACDYIRINPDPIVGLSDMLSGERWFPGQPEKVIDKLYLDILERKLRDLPAVGGLNYFQYIIGSVVVAKTPLTCAQLDSLLGLCPATAKDPLKLPDGSMIKLSTSEGLISSLNSMLRTEDDIVRLLHASLADFLTDPKRCTDARFFIDTSIHNHILAFRCLETLQRILKRDPCGIADPTKCNWEISDLDRRLEEFLSLDGRYACQYWHRHLSDVDVEDDGLYNQAKGFLFSHLLHFFEVKSLQRDVDSIFYIVNTIKLWFSRYPQSAADNAVCLLDDASQFLRQFREPIMENAAHIYISGIPFTARDTVLFKTFAPELHDVPKLCSIPAQSPRLITIPMSGGAAVSPDCTRLACWDSGHGAMQIWDVDGCTPIQYLTDHDLSNGYICLAKYSPDGALICGVDNWGIIYVWDAKTSKAKGHPLSRSGTNVYVRQLSFSECTVLALYEDGVIWVWDIGTGRMLTEQRVQGEDTHLRGAFVTTGELHGDLRVFHLKSNLNDMEECASEQVIRRVQTSLDGQKTAFLLGSDSNPVIRIVKSYNGDTVSSWTPIPGRGGSRISFTDSGTRLVVWDSSTDSTHVRFYDIHSGVLQRDVVMRSMGELVRITADESQLLTWTCLKGNSLKIFDITSGKQTASFDYIGNLHDHADVTDVNYGTLPSGNTRLVAVSCLNTTIWNPASLESQTRHVKSLIISPSSRQFAVAFSDNNIELSDFDGNPSSCTVLPDARQPFAFAPNGSQLLCASSSNTLLCWNLAETAATKPAYIGHDDLITALAFSTNGTRLVTASRDSTIRIWDVKSESLIRSLPCNSYGVVTSLVLSLDESRISYYTANDYTTRTLDAISGHIIGYQASFHDTQRASWSPEGTDVICVSDNGHSCLRDGHTGHHLRHLDVQPRVTHTVFADSMSQFVTISEIGVVDIIDGITSIIQQTLKHFLGTIISLALSLDGKYILVGTNNGYVSMSDVLQGVLLWEAVGYYHVRNMIFSSHEDKVAIVSELFGEQPSYRVTFLERLTGKMLSSRNFPVNQEIIPVEFPPDETQLISITQDHRVEPDIKEDDTIEDSSNIKVAAHRIGGVQVTSYDKSLLAYAHKEYALTLYNATDNSTYVFAKLREPLRLSALSADGSILACVVAEDIWVWDTLIRGSTICQHKSLEGISIISIEISPDAKRLLCCAKESKSVSNSTVVFILDIMNNRIMARHTIGQDFGGQVSLIPGSGHVISTLNRGFKIWDALMEDQLFIYDERNIKYYDHYENRALMSPDGTRMLLSRGSSGRPELWDIKDYKKSPVELGIEMSIYDVALAAFSPDGKYIAYLHSNPSSIAIYDAFTGAILCKTIFEDIYLSHITSLSISKDSTRILLSSMVGNIYIAHVAEPYASMHIVSSLPPSHTAEWPQRTAPRWLENEGKKLLCFPATVKSPWARMGSDPRGLILELETGEITFLDLEEYLKGFELGSGWSKGNANYLTPEEHFVARILANLSQRYTA